MMRITEIGLEYEALEKMRQALDKAIKRGVAVMQEKEAMECVVTLKLEMQNTKWKEQDPVSGKMVQRNPINFNHECKVCVRFEEKEKGGTTDRWELLSGGRVMRLEEQTSMLGEDEEEE